MSIIKFNLDESKSIPLKFTFENIVQKGSKSLKKETTQIECLIRVLEKEPNRTLVNWQIIDVKQKFKGIPKKDRDTYDEILIGVFFKYYVNPLGNIIQYDRPIKAFRMIRNNTKSKVDEGIQIGMQPQFENFVDEVYQELFEGYYLNQLFNVIKKNHSNYGITVESGEKVWTDTFKNKRIAKQEIPAVHHSYIEKEDNLPIIKYKSKKIVDRSKTLELFSLDEKLYKPFNREMLKDFFLNGKFDCMQEQEFIYDQISGIISKSIEINKTLFGNTTTIRKISFEI